MSENPKTCESCYDEKNLITCGHCFAKYCINCILSFKTINNYKKYICPSCKYNYSAENKIKIIDLGEDIPNFIKTKVEKYRDEIAAAYNNLSTSNELREKLNSPYLKTLISTYMYLIDEERKKIKTALEMREFIIDFIRNLLFINPIISDAIRCNIIPETIGKTENGARSLPIIEPVPLQNNGRAIYFLTKNPTETRFKFSEYMTVIFEDQILNFNDLDPIMFSLFESYLKNKHSATYADILQTYKCITKKKILTYREKFADIFARYDLKKYTQPTETPAERPENPAIINGYFVCECIYRKASRIQYDKCSPSDIENHEFFEILTKIKELLPVYLKKVLPQDFARALNFAKYFRNCYTAEELESINYFKQLIKVEINYSRCDQYKIEDYISAIIAIKHDTEAIDETARDIIKILYRAYNFGIEVNNLNLILDFAAIIRRNCVKIDDFRHLYKIKEFSDYTAAEIFGNNSATLKEPHILRCVCGGFVIGGNCLKCKKPINRARIDETENDEETAAEIRETCKRCPVCGVYITKIEGCSHMFCANCKNGFDWNSGKILSEKEQTNRAYFDWVQETNAAEYSVLLNKVLQHKTVLDINNLILSFENDKNNILNKIIKNNISFLKNDYFAYMKIRRLIYVSFYAHFYQVYRSQLIGELLEKGDEITENREQFSYRDEIPEKIGPFMEKIADYIRAEIMDDTTREIERIINLKISNRFFTDINSYITLLNKENLKHSLTNDEETNEKLNDYLKCLNFDFL